MDTFEAMEFTAGPLKKGEYEDCTFQSCDLSHADLSGFRFIDCTFTLCNLSMAKVAGTGFQQVSFKECKALGVQFGNCGKIALTMDFSHCHLQHASFFQLRLRGQKFVHSVLTEVDFSECDLTGAVFDSCDLTGAIFDRTILDRADLRSSYNYTIIPEANKIKKAMFSLPHAIGLLSGYDIIIE